MDGDEFNLKPVNESKGIQYLFTRPQDIAAAAKILVALIHKIWAVQNFKKYL